MSFQSPNDSDDSEVSLHSDASDSSKTHKQKKKRSALKEYFSKQIESTSWDQGRTSPQNKSYSESLFRKRFKKLIHKNEVIQSPAVSFKNATNHSGSDDENSVQTIFPEKLQPSQDKSDDNINVVLNRKESKSDDDDEPEDIEPAIDALDEIHPILGQTASTNLISNISSNHSSVVNNSRTQYSWNFTSVFLMILLSLIIISAFFGAPLYFITLIIGIMIPICTNMIFKKVIDFIKKKLYIQGSGPEKTEFILPKYNEMNILEVPSVEEYQVPKTYEGWINLYPHFSYDPETYHLSDTIPVYVKIKGKHLIVYYTKNHVARRTTYNEPELKLNITSSVVYNLNNAKVSLLPDGLAKIRHWSKKYPICIEIENTTVKNDDVFTNEDFSLDNTITNLEKDDCSDSTTTNTFHDNTQEDEFKDVEDYEENTCARNSVSSLGEDIETNSDNSHLKEDRQRLLLFARANREKYDWYLRILSTIKLLSVKNNDKESNVKCSDDRASGSESSQDETKQIERKESSQNNNIGTSDVDSISTNSKSGDFENVIAEDASKNNVSLMGDQQYLKYMGYFLHGDHKDDTSEISRDFNLSISKDVLWFNVLAGRVLLGILNDPGWIMKIQERIQKKLSTIKLPYYIDELECSELSLGETPPKIHRASKPVMNERGLWVDLDVTYEGLVTLVLSTKLNLMKLKKINAADTVDTNDPCQSSKFQNQKASAIYNSDLEDSADSSTSDDQVQDTNSDKTFSLGSISPTPRKQNNKSFLKVVDQVAASKFFQQATENKFVKKALVAVSNSQLRLQVDFRGLIGELVLNIPNPPSDRLWFGFRKPPRIWLTVHPAFGERNVNFTYVTNWIEKKICQEIVKNLVLPNMEDLIIPILLPQT